MHWSNVSFCRKRYISEDGTEADGYVNSEEAVKTTSFLADLIAKGYANVEPIKDEFFKRSLRNHDWRFLGYSCSGGKCRV